MKDLRAAVIQMRSGADRSANLRTARELVLQAAKQGAELVALPEVVAWRGPKDQEVAQGETLQGPTVQALSAVAAEARVWIVGGSFLERLDGDDRCYNTATLFAPDGDLVASYRKIHLFDIDIPGQVSVRESDTRRAGSETICVETPFGRIGLAVCYDLRFPELFRRLADAGAEVVVMPSAFTLPTGRAHWHPLIRARAIENQCYFLAPNQFGSAAHDSASPTGLAEYGHSLIVDPWGSILAEAPEDTPAVIVADLDAALLAKVRRDLPSLEHRRLPT
ncbi:MAG: putative amidohydrolase [Hyphomicrobiaceae bacterium]|jgi:predicted amidohydrolase